MKPTLDTENKVSWKGWISLALLIILFSGISKIRKGHWRHLILQTYAVLSAPSRMG